MSYEDDLRQRLELLKEQLEAGKIVIADHLADDFRASLAAVRYGPDGQVDLDTVDGRIRSFSLAVAGMQYREDVKKLGSLRDIQVDYFTSIDNNFGELYRNMIEIGATPHQFARIISQDDENVEYLYPIISKFMDALTDFWTSNAKIVTYHLQDLSVAKGVFGGDLFPVGNIASTCGLYLDTIVLTDPFMNSRGLFERWGKREAVRYFIKNAMNVLSYKELALADVSPPIVVILPFESSYDEQQMESIGGWAESDALTHGSRIFGRTFSSMEEFLEFGASLDTPEKVARVVSDPSRVLFDTDWTGSLEKQIERAFSEFGDLAGAPNPGSYIVGQSFSRMMQATDLQAKSRSLGGTPLIEAETSWRYFNWKLEYDAPVGEDNLPLHLLQGLQWAGRNEIQWLGRIPPAALIEMRQQGAVEEIRSVLTTGIEEVSEATESDFMAIGGKIVENINSAFAKHQEAIAELKRKKLRFWGHDIGTWVVTGAIEVGAAFIATPFLGVASFAASQVTDAPKLKDIPKRLSELSKDQDRVRKSPLGLFFKHRN